MVTIHYKGTDSFKSTEINIWSGVIQPDENIIWEHIEQKGFFQKHFSKKYAISNFRIFIYDYEIEKITGLLMMSDLDDVVVTDTYRSFASTRVGGYAYGLSGGQSRGQSITVGKITFMSKGQPIIAWNGVSDPNGIRRLTLSTKKATYPKRELERFLSGIKNEELQSRTSCSCGHVNQSGSSFCNDCGRILK